MRSGSGGSEEYRFIDGCRGPKGTEALMPAERASGIYATRMPILAGPTSSVNARSNLLHHVASAPQGPLVNDHPMAQCD